MNKTSIEKTAQNAQDLHFGAFLRKLRILSNKSFADIARANNRENGAIFQQIEVGYSDNPTLRSLLAYAKGLEVPLSTLVAMWETEIDSERSILWQLTTVLLKRKCPNFSTHGKCKINDDCFCGNVVAPKQTIETAELLEANRALIALLEKNSISFDKNLLK